MTPSRPGTPRGANPPEVRWAPLFEGIPLASQRPRPARRVDRDLRAIGALTQAVLDGDDIERLLGRVAGEARSLVDAVSGVVVTVAGDPGTITFRAVDGLTVGPLRLGFTMPVRGTLTELALARGSKIVARNAAEIPPEGRAFATATGTGPLIAAPLVRVGSARGVLVVARLEGAEPFRPADIQLVSTFATQAGSAIELFDLRAVEAGIAVDVERERIARDLHDGVVQSLFGLGMTLRALSERSGEKAAAASLREAVERLDEAIATVRTYIGELTVDDRGMLNRDTSPTRNGAPSSQSRPDTAPRAGPADAIAAIDELARASATSAKIDDVLAGLVDGVVAQARAGFGVLGTLTEDGDHLLVRARHGPELPGTRVGNTRRLDETFMHESIKRGRPFVIGAVERAERPLPESVQQVIGPLVHVPLVVRGRVLGAFAVGRPHGAAPFSRTEIGLIEAHGAQAAIALEFERVRKEIRRGSISAERDRIGRDLHERVIQLLFGVGLSLQGLEAGAGGTARASLRSAVEVLDRAIRDLRRYVFGLEPTVIVDRPLHEELEVIAADLMAGAGIELDLEIEPVVSSLLAGAAPDVLQIAREALSNVVRHAGARRCSLRIISRDGHVVLEVSDDGGGVEANRPGSGHGLSNMRSRASALGAELEIHGSAGVGTTVRMTVPV